jgi:uncharacterized protein
LQIEYIICPDAIEDKIERKHHVTQMETRQVLLNATRIRFAERGHVSGEDVYVAFGQAFGGRYLAAFFVYKADAATAVLISARDMTVQERKIYGRK